MIINGSFSIAMLGYKKVLNMVDFDGSDKVEPPKNIFF